MHISQSSTAQISVPEQNYFLQITPSPKKETEKHIFLPKEYLTFLLSFRKALENIWLAFCILTSLNMRHQSKLNNKVIYIPFGGRGRGFIPRWMDVVKGGKVTFFTNGCSALKAAVILTFMRTQSFGFSNDPLGARCVQRWLTWTAAMSPHLEKRLSRDTEREIIMSNSMSSRGRAFKTQEIAVKHKTVTTSQAPTHT